MKRMICDEGHRGDDWPSMPQCRTRILVPQVKNGFTLIELSIVLVIIGLLVGGIIAGRDLIRISKIRSILSQIEDTKIAVSTFKNKFNCLPGDCPNATNFFSDARLVNGNGNGRIGGYADASEQRESYLAWLDLELAGLISGTYTGTTGPGHPNRNAIPGTNVPAMKADKAVGIYLGYAPNLWVAPDLTAHMYQISVPPSPTCCEMFGPYFTPAEEQWMDSKIDDGVAGKGMARDVTQNNYGTCTWGVSYAVSTTNGVCSFAVFQVY